MIAEIEPKLQNGYNKLISFKTKENGYEWFGSSPANEPLSAYGLLHFTELAAVTNLVDQDMLA